MNLRRQNEVKALFFKPFGVSFMLDFNLCIFFCCCCCFCYVKKKKTLSNFACKFYYRVENKPKYSKNKHKLQ